MSAWRTKVLQTLTLSSALLASSQDERRDDGHAIANRVLNQREALCNSGGMERQTIVRAAEICSAQMAIPQNLKNFSRSASSY
jgi:hypothetical protein